MFGLFGTISATLASVEETTGNTLNRSLGLIDKGLDMAENLADAGVAATSVIKLEQENEAKIKGLEAQRDFQQFFIDNPQFQLPS